MTKYNFPSIFLFLEIMPGNTVENKSNLIVNNNQPEIKIVYAVIVDAGSTGSRALAFKFIQTPSNNLVRISIISKVWVILIILYILIFFTDGSLELLDSKKFSTEPGLSGYADNPNNVDNVNLNFMFVYLKFF